MKLKVILHPGEGGRFWAEVPGFPGCVSEGDTREQALANVQEAFEGVLEVLQENAVVHPEDATPQDMAVVIEV